MLYLKYCLLAMMVILLITALWVIVFGLKEDKVQVDAAIVLGAKIRSNETPSSALASRLKKSIELFQQKKVNYILVSGGMSEAGVTEASVMKAYLEKRNIPSDRIIVEDQSKDTKTNAEYSVAIMKKRGLKSFIVVSQYFHLLRASLTFKNLGFQNVYTAPAALVQPWDLYSIGREVLGLFYYATLK